MFYRDFLYILVTTPPTPTPPSPSPPTPPPPPQQKCANFSTTITESKCIGCDPAKRGQYPWQVELSRNQSGLKIFKCGGSLISSKLVLTAAHCIPSPQLPPWNVTLGQIDLSEDEPEKIVAKGNKRHMLFEGTRY